MTSESFRIFPSKDLSSFKRALWILLKWMQWRKNVMFAKSISKLQVHSGLPEFSKLWLSLCLFRWLSPSLNLVSKRRPNWLRMSYTRFGEGRMTLRKYFLNILKECLRKVKSLLFHSRMVQGKNECLKVSVLQWFVVTSSEFPELERLNT